MKILIYDIETAPIVSYIWSLHERNFISPDQILSDWHVLSWAAKWFGAPAKEIMYADQRTAKVLENDLPTLKGIWSLLDEADAVITQNGKQFDQKKLNARFVINGLQPPSSYKHIDVKEVAKRKFGFTSNRLSYMTEKFCTKYKKLKHKKYPGFELWKACLAKDQEAWKELELYNKYDVLSLEELYTVLMPWDSTLNWGLYSESDVNVCKCGGQFKRNGLAYTAVGKYQRYRCVACGFEMRGAENLFSKDRRASMYRNL